MDPLAGEDPSQMDPGPGMGVTKASFANFSVTRNFDLPKV